MGVEADPSRLPGPGLQPPPPLSFPLAGRWGCRNPPPWPALPSKLEASILGASHPPPHPHPHKWPLPTHNPFPHFIFPPQHQQSLAARPSATQAALRKKGKRERDQSTEEWKDGRGSEPVGSVERGQGPSSHAQVAHVPSQQAPHIWTQLASPASRSTCHRL